MKHSVFSQRFEPGEHAQRINEFWPQPRAFDQLKQGGVPEPTAFYDDRCQFLIWSILKVPPITTAWLAHFSSGSRCVDRLNRFLRGKSRQLAAVTLQISAIARSRGSISMSLDWRQGFSRLHSGSELAHADLWYAGMTAPLLNASMGIFLRRILSIRSESLAVV
jgi:hypothetical protein